MQAIRDLQQMGCRFTVLDGDKIRPEFPSGIPKDTQKVNELLSKVRGNKAEALAYLQSGRDSPEAVQLLVQAAYSGQFEGTLTIPIRKNWQDVWGVEQVTVVRTEAEAQRQIKSRPGSVVFYAAEFKVLLDGIAENGLEPMKAVIRAKRMFCGEILQGGVKPDCARVQQR